MMKKIFALLITLIYLTSNAGFAFSSLYYLNNTTEQSVESIIKPRFSDWNYRLEKENPYYIVSNKNSNDYAVIIFQQSGSNVFYYYYSNDKYTETNQAILRTFRNFGIKYEKSTNTNVLNIYDNIAQKTISSNSYNEYSFNDEDQYEYSNQPISTTPSSQYSYQNNSTTYSQNYPSQNQATAQQTGYNPIIATNQPTYNQTQNTIVLPQIGYGPQVPTNTTVRTQTTAPTSTSTVSATLKGSVVQLASGTKLKTYLQNPINTSSANKGDRIVAVLTDDLRYNGVNVIPQGSLIYGTLTKARQATYGSRNGRVVIEFTQIVTPENKFYEISTEKIDFTVTNDGKVARTVGNTVAGAAVGALAGLLFAAMGDFSFGAAAAIGAGVGAGTALASSGAERGVDAEIPSFTELEVTLTRPLSVSVTR